MQTIIHWTRENERETERGKGGPHPRPRARGLRSRRDMQTQNGRALARPPAGKGILSVRGPQSEAEPSSFLNGRSSVARTTKRGKTRARGRPRPSLIGDDADNFVSYRHSLERDGRAKSRAAAHGMLQVGRTIQLLSLISHSLWLGIDALLTNSALTFGGVEIMMKHCRAIASAS